MEPALAMLIKAKLPSSLWPFALKHVISVRSQVPHSNMDATPYSVLTGERSDFKSAGAFGSTAHVLRIPLGTKLKHRAIKGVSFETNLDHGIYRVLVSHDDGMPSLVKSRHVTFDECKLPGATDLQVWINTEEYSDKSLTSDGWESLDEYSSVNFSDEDTISDDEVHDIGDDDRHIGVTNQVLPVDVVANGTWDLRAIDTDVDETQHIEDEGSEMESESLYPRWKRNKPPK